MFQWLWMNQCMFLILLPNWIKLQSLYVKLNGEKLTSHLHLAERHILR